MINDDRRLRNIFSYLKNKTII